MTGILGPMPTDEALTEAADPVRARVALARLLERPTARARLDGGVPPALLRLLGFSTAAVDFFLAQPDEIAALSEAMPRSASVLCFIEQPIGSQSPTVFGTVKVDLREELGAAS